MTRAGPRRDHSPQRLFVVASVAKRGLPATGFEPVTCGLGNRRSIQLSYAGVSRDDQRNVSPPRRREQVGRGSQRGDCEHFGAARDMNTTWHRSCRSVAILWVVTAFGVVVRASAAPSTRPATQPSGVHKTISKMVGYDYLITFPAGYDGTAAAP